MELISQLFELIINPAAALATLLVSLGFDFSLKKLTNKNKFEKDGGDNE